MSLPGAAPIGCLLFLPVAGAFSNLKSGLMLKDFRSCVNIAVSLTYSLALILVEASASKPYPPSLTFEAHSVHVTSLSAMVIRDDFLPSPLGVHPIEGLLIMANKQTCI